MGPLPLRTRNMSSTHIARRYFFTLAGERERTGINISLCSRTPYTLSRRSFSKADSRRNCEKNLNLVSRAFVRLDRGVWEDYMSYYKVHQRWRLPTSLIPYFDKAKFEFLRVRRALNIFKCKRLGGGETCGEKWKFLFQLSFKSYDISHLICTHHKRSRDTSCKHKINV